MLRAVDLWLDLPISYEIFDEIDQLLAYPLAGQVSAR